MTGDDNRDRDEAYGRHESGSLDHGLPIGWSVTASDGLLQGPLDLEFLRGRRLALALFDGQMALLTGEGRLQAVYLPGDHLLTIGDADGQIPPAWRLVFLSPGEGIVLRWTHALPLRCGGKANQTLIGTCRFGIDRPHAFHDTFLAGVEGLEPAFTLGLIDRLVQGVVAQLLAPVQPGRDSRAPAELQARLMAMRPEDLNDELAPCGLTCLELALYTAEPPVDAERSRQPDVAAGEPIPMSGHSEDLRRN